MEHHSRTRVLVLSVSKDGLRAATPWFDKLTTGLARAAAGST